MDQETKELINEKIKEFLESDEILDFNKAVELIKAINNPSSCN